MHIVTNPYATVEVASSKSQILKSIFCALDEASMPFSSGTHFNKMSLSTLTKNKLTEKIVGRNLIDLAKNMLKNATKSIIAAEEWLTDGELPSGRSCGGLCAHVLSKHEGMSP